MRAQFTGGELRDIARHGADAGWSGLIYYRETSALYDQYAADLWEMLNEDAEALGHNSVLELMAGLGGAAQVASDATFKNLVVWYGAERVAQASS